MAVAAATAAPVAVAPDEDPPTPPCLFLTTVVEVFARGQSPSRVVCSVLAMLWFRWEGRAQDKELFLGGLLLGLARFLKSKMGGLVAELLSCFCCHRGNKGDKQPVTMSFSILGGWCWFSFLDGAATFCEILQDFQELVNFRGLISSV